MTQQATTGIYNGTPGGYVRRVAVMWLIHRWWAWLLPVAVCCVAAAWEPVWIFVALMLIFLLYPSLMMMIYFYHVLSPEAQRSLLPHTVTVCVNTIVVDYHDERNTQSDRYSRNDIHSVETDGSGITVRLKHPRYAHIHIPVAVIPQAETELFMTMATNLSPQHQADA